MKLDEKIVQQYFRSIYNKNNARCTISLETNIASLEMACQGFFHYVIEPLHSQDLEAQCHTWLSLNYHSECLRARNSSFNVIFPSI